MRNMRVYFLSRRTSIDSRTLLHFLITSRRPRKVVSSFSAPRVAVSIATSSTSARRKSRLPMNSNRTARRSHSASDSLVGGSTTAIASEFSPPPPPIDDGMPHAAPPPSPPPPPFLGGGLVGTHPPASYASLIPTASSWKVLRADGARLGSFEVAPGALWSW